MTQPQPSLLDSENATERFVVLDTETTGLDPTKDRLIEIGLVEIVDRRVTGRVFHTYLNPEQSIDPGASVVHGIYDADVAEAPLFRDKAQDILEFIGAADVIAHNASFDVRFIDSELDRAGRSERMGDRGAIMDTLQSARQMFPGQRATLDALCDRLGVDRGHRKVHGALLDASLLAEVYLAMTRGQGRLDLARDESGPRRSKLLDRLGQGGALPVIRATEEEMDCHLARMAVIKERSGRPAVMDIDPTMP